MTLPFRLMVITDWSVPDLVRRVDAICDLEGLALQHRHPGVSDRQFLDEAKQLAERCGRTNTPLFINRRLDVALAVGAHMHLPAHGLRVSDVKPYLPAGRWVSHAVHHEAELQPGADLALISPVFQPGSKPADERPLLGLEGFSRLAAMAGCPAFALGGFTVESPRPADAAGLAVVSAVWRAADPRLAALHLLGAPVHGP